MVSCKIYDARVIAKHLHDNRPDKESVFLQGSAFLLLALIHRNLSNACRIPVEFKSKKLTKDNVLTLSRT